MNIKTIFTGFMIIAMVVLFAVPGHAVLVAHWKLDDGLGSTTAADSSVNSNTGTLTLMEPSTDWVTGIVDGALDFDGYNDFVDAGNDASLNMSHEITVAAWVKLSGRGSILSKRTSDESNGNWAFRTTGAIDSTYKLQWLIWQPHTEISSTGSISLNVWTHVAVTFNDVNNTIKFYINGILDRTYTTATADFADNPETVKIGYDGQSVRHKGLIDDARIYNNALSDQAVLALYSGVPEPASVLFVLAGLGLAVRRRFFLYFFR